MKRLRALLVMLAVLTGIFSATPAPAAGSELRACADTTAIVEPGDPLRFDGLIVTRLSIRFMDGCTELGHLTGMMVADCTNWSGTGRSWFGGSFFITGVGPTLVLNGAVSGTIQLLNWAPFTSSFACGTGSRLFKGPAALTYELPS